MAEAPAVIFDLDGTLTDSGPGIARSVRYAIERFNETTGARIPFPDETGLRAMVGPPLRASFARLAGADNVEAILGFYRERYAAVGLFENNVYVGVFEALRALRDTKARLFVATSKLETYARKILEHFELAPFFVEIFGALEGGAREQKSELLAALKAREGGRDPWRAVMIGDRKFDAIGASAVGIRTIGVLWGFGDEAELRAAGADPLIATPRDIPAAVGAVFSGAR